ncbi:hypothetical protein BGX38DRAFT_1147778 [Terfezia claveryi]|nr:hypothetical protein BGX38DRAFT_1147778 [Terfezia claveryi]
MSQSELNKEKEEREEYLRDVLPEEGAIGKSKKPEEKEKKEMKPLRSRYIFLTYPQADEDAKAMLQELYKTKYPPMRYYGCKEDHEKTGGKHFHFLMDIGTTKCGSAPKIKGKNAHKTWDIMINGKIYHPNIAPVRDIDKAWHYIDKCNDINHPKHGPGETFGDMKDQCSSKVGHVQQNKWHHIISADTKEDFFERMKQMDPESYVKSFANVKAYATEKYPEKKKEVFKPKIENRRPWRRISEIEDYLDIFVRSKYLGRQISLCIIGGTQLGKSEFVTQLGPQFVISNEWNANRFEEKPPLIHIQDVEAWNMPQV